MNFLQDNPDVKSLMENRPLKLILTGFMLILCIGLLQTFVPSLLTGLVAVPTMMIMLLVAIALIVNILFGWQSKTYAEKQKRGLQGADMYSMIDRLVNELDADEMAYLRRRLEEHEPGNERELSHSLESLLDKRSEGRQTQQP